MSGFKYWDKELNYDEIALLLQYHEIQFTETADIKHFKKKEGTLNVMTSKDIFGRYEVRFWIAGISKDKFMEIIKN